MLTPNSLENKTSIMMSTFRVWIQNSKEKSIVSSDLGFWWGSTMPTTALRKQQKKERDKIET